ncbi:hypothetical protein B0H67DRAFT_638204 [Lasiosphaeris hirsuta]|uniref:Ankyrin repeat protein n=1 Tax=Lasiosphaeris hirsuta TaxID=260670 RepID=A0AA40E7A4_9PEZI|nr:hypothetical protein B0H67DRAFT_638204 [Lasiosphaeris hirsuta]
MDGWIIKHQYLAFLQRFMELQIPTVHAFAKYVFESAICTKRAPVLNEPLDRDVDFRSVAEDIASIGDHGFTRRVLMKVDSEDFKKYVGRRLFHRFVRTGLFDLAKFLPDDGVSVDARDLYNKTALLIAANGNEVEQVRFLIEAGAHIPAHSYWEYDQEIGSCPLTRAVFKKTDFVTLMLNHHPHPNYR